MQLKNEHYSYILMLGHLCVDMSVFALGAITPFLVTQRGLTFTQVTGLGFAFSLVNGLTQPFLGAMADRYSRPWLMTLGLFLASIGISALGFLHSYALMMLAVAVSALGGALYHPDGGRMANFVSGTAKGRGVSNFAFGGNMAGFVGPVVAVAAISAFGLKGTLVLFFPAVLMAAVFLLLMPKFNAFAEENRVELKAAIRHGQRDDWNGFLRLSGVTLVRAAVMSCMNSFIPLFWLSILMQSEEISGLSTTLIALAGAIATFIGGRIGDRMGYRRMIRIGLVTLVPCLAILAYTRSIFVSALVLIPASVALNLAYSPTVVLGQKLIPNHVGLASGVTMGLASSIGGVVSPMLGRVGDVAGIDTVMWIIVAIGALAALSTLFLPKDPDPVSSED